MFPLVMHTRPLSSRTWVPKSRGTGVPMCRRFSKINNDLDANVSDEASMHSGLLKDSGGKAEKGMIITKDKGSNRQEE
jgi:hypothetical protein